MSNFVVHTSHPVQPRGQIFTLDRKILTVHSFDRDITKWKNSNHFEVDLPEAVTNIQSIRLVQISLPSNQFVFSNEYQNTKLSYTDNLPGGTTQDHTITIAPGSYTAQELAIEISNRMNQISYSNTFPSGIGPIPLPPLFRGLYVCKYNEIENTFWFGNTGNQEFILNFDFQHLYTTKCNQPIMWKHYVRWGLPAYLGYHRKKYTAVKTTDNGSGFVINTSGAPTFPTESGTTGMSYGFSHEITSIAPYGVWLDGGTGGSTGTDNSGNYLVDATDNCQIDIFGEQAIYMEIDRFNSMDEIEPYSENTMGTYNNDLNGKVKAAFAKIPILQSQFTQQTDNANNNLMNISHYNPVIERINRLKFKFRYHDGRLVDFDCVPFNFSLEFNCLRDRMDKKMTIIVPPLY